MKLNFEIEKLKDQYQIGEEVKNIINLLMEIGNYYAIGCSRFWCVEIEGESLHKLCFVNSIKVGWGDPGVTTDFSWITYNKEKGVKLDTYSYAHADGISKEWASISEAYKKYSTLIYNWIEHEEKR